MIQSKFLVIRTFLLLALVAPFSFGAAGYTLDISETIDDEDDRFPVRILRVDHQTEGEVYVRHTLDAIEIYSKKPTQTLWPPPLIKMVFEYNQNGTVDGVRVIYDGFEDYLSFKFATSNDFEMVLLDAIGPSLQYRDADFWQDLYLLGDTAVPGDDCESELIEMSQRLFGIISAQQSLARLVHFNNLVQQADTRNGECSILQNQGPAAYQQ